MPDLPARSSVNVESTFAGARGSTANAAGGRSNNHNDNNHNDNSHNDNNHDDVLGLALQRLVKRWNRESDAIYRRELRRGNPHITSPPRVPEELAQQALADLQGWVYRRSPRPVELTMLTRRWGWGIDPRRLLRPLLELPELTLLHFVRLMVMIRRIDPATTASPQRYRTIGNGIDAFLRCYRASHAQPCGLQELAEAFTAAGLDDRCIGWARLLSEPRRQRLDLEADATWPYFAARPQMLVQALALPADDPRFDRRTRRTLRSSALQIIGMMPAPPVLLQDLLWQIALDGTRQERAPAQTALERLGSQQQPVAAALCSPRWQRRAAAAEWLGRLAAAGDPSASRRLHASLRQALAAEGSSRVRAVLQRCLGNLRIELEDTGKPSARRQSP